MTTGTGAPSAAELSREERAALQRRALTVLMGGQVVKKIALHAAYGRVESLQKVKYPQPAVQGVDGDWEGAIETPGMNFGGPLSDERRSMLPSKDSYVEAAIRLALATPDSCTGKCFNDKEALEFLAPEIVGNYRWPNA